MQYIHHLLGYEPDMPSCAAIDIEDQLAEAEGRKPDPTPTVEEILDEVLLDYLLQPHQPDDPDVADRVLAALDIATGNPTSWRDVLNDGARFQGWISSMRDELDKLLRQFKTFRIVPIREMYKAKAEDPDTRCLFEGTSQ